MKFTKMMKDAARAEMKEARRLGKYGDEPAPVKILSYEELLRLGTDELIEHAYAELYNDALNTFAVPPSGSEYNLVEIALREGLRAMLGHGVSKNPKIETPTSPAGIRAEQAAWEFVMSGEMSRLMEKD